MKRSTKISIVIILFVLIIAGVITARYMIGLHFQKKFGARPAPGIIVTTVNNFNFTEKIETFGTAIPNKSNGTFKNKEDLIKIFEKTGLKKSEKPVFTCGSGVTASVLAMTFRLIHNNYSPTIYDGSWNEYGKIR